MLKLFHTFILYLIIISFANCQELITQVQFKYVDQDYSWSSKTKSEIDSFYYQLIPIQQSTYKTHIRISFVSQIIDLFSNDDLNFTGILTNRIIEFNTKENSCGEYENFPYAYYFQKTLIDPSKVIFAMEKLFTSNFFKILTDSLIPSWSKNFLHCNGVLIESNINGLINNQAFSCPRGQSNSIMYSGTINENLDLFENLFLLKSKYNEFLNSLPKGAIYSNDYYRKSYIPTNLENKV